MEGDPYKDLNIAVVLSWISRSWKLVNSRTISRRFTRCGFIKSPAVSAEPETKIPEVEQQLQDAEQADNAVFYPPAEPSEIMKQARKNVQIRTLSGDAVQKSKPDCDSADEDTKEPPSSSKIKQNLEEILVYATLRGDTEFLDGKLNLNAYSDVVASRVIVESKQTKLTDYFRPKA